MVFDANGEPEGGTVHASDADDTNKEEGRTGRDEERSQNGRQDAEGREEMMDIKGLCRYLKIGRTSAYALVTSGDIPCFRVRRALRMRRADVDRWLDDNRYRDEG
jgi:excisionase family DNA binding protein